MPFRSSSAPRLRSRTAKIYLLCQAGLHAVGVVAAWATHDAARTYIGDGIAVVIALGSLTLLQKQQMTRRQNSVVLGGMVTAGLVAAVFHVSLVAQMWSLIELAAVAMYVRAFWKQRTARVICGVVSALTVAALIVSSAPVHPFWWVLFPVAIIGMAEAFGALLAEAMRPALTDPLTGARNRAGLEIDAADLLERAARDKRPILTIALDIDHFKKINDTHGHPAGDGVLAGLVSHWDNMLPAGSVLGRIGGDEFLILVAGVRDELVPPLVESLVSTNIAGVSAGFAFSRDGSRPLSELYRLADEHLYQQKRERGIQPLRH